VPEDVGWRGQNAVQAILAASDRMLNWKPKSPRIPFEQVIAEWLVEMKLLHSFSVSPIAPDRDEYEVRVKTSARAEEVRLTDVGVGVSQVLPVLVQDLLCTAAFDRSHGAAGDTPAPRCSSVAR